MQTLRLLALPIVACLLFSTGCATTGKSGCAAGTCPAGIKAACAEGCTKKCCAEKCGTDCKKACCAHKKKS